MIVKGFDELRERLSAFQKRRFCLAMSGHRNVLPSAVDAVKRGTWDALEFLRKTMGEPLCVLCGLAVGADQIVAEAVLRNRESAGTPGVEVLADSECLASSEALGKKTLGAEVLEAEKPLETAESPVGLPESAGLVESPEAHDVLVAILPMPRAIYEEDFEQGEVVEFARLAERADAVFELDLEPEGRQWLKAHSGGRLPIELRMLQYELLGEVLARLGDGLLVLWDGIPVKCGADGRTAFWERGGTADVVRKFLELRNSRVPELQGWRVLKAGASLETSASEEGPANHDCGRVVHVAVPRTKKGQVRFAAGLEAGEIRELTLNPQNPSAGEIS